MTDAPLLFYRGQPSRQSVIPYEPVRSSLTGPQSGLVLNSMSGADITCNVIVPRPPGWKEYLQSINLKPEEYDLPLLKAWAELETLSISSARSVSPVRRLGEHHVHEYTRGSRTIGGSMIFTTFNRDVFADLYRAWPGESFFGADRSPPFHVDQMPPFHVFINGMTEYGTVAQAALINVTLTNFGTTFSVHDLKTESTYTYVAQFFYPWVQNTVEFQRLVKVGVAYDGLERLSDEVAKRNSLYEYEAQADIKDALNGMDKQDREAVEEYIRMKFGGRVGPYPEVP